MSPAAEPYDAAAKPTSSELRWPSLLQQHSNKLLLVASIGMWYLFHFLVSGVLSLCQMDYLRAVNAGINEKDIAYSSLLMDHTLSSVWDNARCPASCACS